MPVAVEDGSGSAESGGARTLGLDFEFVATGKRNVRMLKWNSGGNFRCGGKTGKMERPHARRMDFMGWLQQLVDATADEKTK